MSDTGIGLLLTGLGVLLFRLGATLFFWLMRRPWRRVERNMQRGGVAEGVVVAHQGWSISRMDFGLRVLGAYGVGSALGHLCGKGGPPAR